jgi:hypothetical protein
VRLAAAAALAALLVVGCGGGGGKGGSSDAAAPPADAGAFQTANGFCAQLPALSGGDLVGTWTVVAACALSTGAPAGCANVSMLSLSLAAQGTVTFNADQTASIDVTVTMKKTSDVATICVPGGDCPSVQSTLADEARAGAGADAGTSAGATCAASSADPTRCACEQDFAPHVFQSAGSYRFELPTYLQGQGGLELQGGYGVQGNTLVLDGFGFDGTELDLVAQR